MPLPCGLQHRMVLVFEIARVLPKTTSQSKTNKTNYNYEGGRVKGTGEGPGWSAYRLADLKTRLA